MMSDQSASDAAHENESKNYCQRVLTNQSQASNSAGRSVRNPGNSNNSVQTEVIHQWYLDSRVSQLASFVRYELSLS